MSTSKSSKKWGLNDLLDLIREEISELAAEIKELEEKLNLSSQEVFTAKEAANYLRISYDTILRLTRVGALEYIPNGASYLFHKSSLHNWISENKRYKQS